jgi:sugar/nucleoside kinase (ribokinase family)
MGIEFLSSGARKVDILLLNKIEVEKVFKSLDIGVIAEWIRENNPSLKFIIKMGSEGILFLNPEENEYLRIPSIPVERFGMEVVNTVGSGDAFIGVLASHLSRTGDLVESIMVACCAGAYKATRPETRGSPEYKELMKLYERAKDIIYIEKARL